MSLLLQPHHHSSCIHPPTWYSTHTRNYTMRSQCTPGVLLPPVVFQVAVCKPASIPIHPCGAYMLNSLVCAGCAVLVCPSRNSLARLCPIPWRFAALCCFMLHLVVSCSLYDLLCCWPAAYDQTSILTKEHAELGPLFIIHRIDRLTSGAQRWLCTNVALVISDCASCVCRAGVVRSFQCCRSKDGQPYTFKRCSQNISCSCSWQISMGCVPQSRPGSQLASFSRYSVAHADTDICAYSPNIAVPMLFGPCRARRFMRLTYACQAE